MKKVIVSIFTLSYLIITPYVFAQNPIQMKGKAASKAATVAKIKGTKAAVLGGKIEKIDGKILTVSKDGVNHTIYTDNKTILRRKFWGKAAFFELQIGDTVNVHGKYQSEDEKTITAYLIRDLSIQKRFGAFIGTVESISGNTIIFNTQNRGKQTATIASSSKIVNRKEQKIKTADVLSNHRIRVKGLWNSADNTITQVVQVKDFSIPSPATPTIKN